MSVFKLNTEKQNATSAKKSNRKKNDGLVSRFSRVIKTEKFVSCFLCSVFFLQTNRYTCIMNFFQSSKLQVFMKKHAVNHFSV